MSVVIRNAWAAIGGGENIIEGSKRFAVGKDIEMKLPDQSEQAARGLRNFHLDRVLAIPLRREASPLALQKGLRFTTT